MSDLHELTDEQLEEIIERAQTILAARRRGDSPVFTFRFEATSATSLTT